MFIYITDRHRVYLQFQTEASSLNIRLNSCKYRCKYTFNIEVYMRHVYVEIVVQII